jgi:Domain of unknown function (DUF4440)
MTAGGGGVHQEVSDSSAAWDAALVANDATAFSSFVADDWVYVGPSGAVPKSDLVEWIASGRLAHRTMTTIGVARVAAHGDTVMVTARKASTDEWEREPTPSRSGSPTPSSNNLDDGSASSAISAP